LSYLIGFPLLYAFITGIAILVFDEWFHLRDASGSISQPVQAVAGLLIVGGDIATFWYVKVRGRVPGRVP
jgi:hypothetical protein